jgi:hypothetical protein
VGRWFNPLKAFKPNYSFWISDDHEFHAAIPTIDEPVHLLGGYSYLKWRDFRVNPEHPPLVKMWAALPLLWMNVHDPRPANALWGEIAGTEPGGPAYPFAREMLFSQNDATKLFFTPNCR